MRIFAMGLALLLVGCDKEEDEETTVNETGSCLLVQANSTFTNCQNFRDVEVNSEGQLKKDCEDAFGGKEDDTGTFSEDPCSEDGATAKCLGASDKGGSADLFVFAATYNSTAKTWCDANGGTYTELIAAED